MRGLFVLGLLCLAAVQSANAQDASMPLNPSIAQCIRDNAPKVEAAVPDLNAAVDFLTSKVCAEPVAKLNALSTKHQQERTADYWKELCDKQKTAKDSGGKNAANMANWCGLQDNTRSLLLITGADDEDGGGLYNSNTIPPASATALAAQLLLELRLSHSKSGSR